MLFPIGTPLEPNIISNGFRDIRRQM